MKTLESIHFTPLQKEDISLLIKWFKKPHVMKFWRNELSLEKFDAHIKKKYSEYITSEWVFPYLAFVENQPVGYIDGYMAWREGNGWWENEEEGTFGIDLFIGEEKCLNRGVGTRMVTQFLDILFRDFKAKTVIVDVDPKNLRALACYKKVGFVSSGEVETPDGRFILMRIGR